MPVQIPQNPAGLEQGFARIGVLQVGHLNPSVALEKNCPLAPGERDIGSRLQAPFCRSDLAPVFLAQVVQSIGEFELA